jgi:hypothetical protein
MTRFVIVFEPARGVDGIRALRAVLKRAKRQYGLVAIDAREESAPTTVAGALHQRRRDVGSRLKSARE